MKTSSLLIDEIPLVISPTLACNVGLEQSIILQKLHYMSSNPRLGKTDEDGRKWIRMTNEEWVEALPWMSRAKLIRLLKTLEEDDLAISRVFTGRSKWYCLNYDKINTLETPIERLQRQQSLIKNTIKLDDDGGESGGNVTDCDEAKNIVTNRDNTPNIVTNRDNVSSQIVTKVVTICDASKSLSKIHTKNHEESKDSLNHGGPCSSKNFSSETSPQGEESSQVSASAKNAETAGSFPGKKQKKRSKTEKAPDEVNEHQEIIDFLCSEESGLNIRFTGALAKAVKKCRADGLDLAEAKLWAGWIRDVKRSSCPNNMTIWTTLDEFRAYKVQMLDKDNQEMRRAIADSLGLNPIIQGDRRAQWELSQESQRIIDANLSLTASQMTDLGRYYQIRGKTPKHRFIFDEMAGFQAWLKAGKPETTFTDRPKSNGRKDHRANANIYTVKPRIKPNLQAILGTA